MAITAVSVYLPTKNKSSQGNSIEIAYGTSTGIVRVIVQYPWVLYSKLSRLFFSKEIFKNMYVYNYFYRETVGQGPQLYQTFSMHTSPVVDILLSDKSLGMISYFRFRWKMNFSVKSNSLKDNFMKIFVKWEI